MKNRSQVIDDLLEKPGHLIRRAHQMSVAIFECEASSFGITAPQHVVMTALFYGWGLGLFGWLSRAQVYGVVPLVWIALYHLHPLVIGVNPAP